MRESELLGPVDAAELVAPIIDRLRLSIVHLLRDHGDRLAAFGLAPSSIGTVAMVRNAAPDRVVTRQQVLAAQRYSPADAVHAALDDALSAGVLVAPEPGLLALGAAGLELVAAYHDVVGEALADRWAGHEERVEGLLDLTALALEGAAATGGEAFALVHPVFEPETASPALVLAERLTPLRFHRFDAHVAAWQATGLGVEEVVALPPGEQRDAIEADTNRRAAAAYEPLLPWERLELIACLGALPG